MQVMLVSWKKIAKVLSCQTDFIYMTVARKFRQLLTDIHNFSMTVKIQQVLGCPTTWVDSANQHTHTHKHTHTHTHTQICPKSPKSGHPICPTSWSIATEWKTGGFGTKPSKISKSTHSLMMIYISYNQMKQIRIIWMLDSDSNHHAFHHSTHSSTWWPDRKLVRMWLWEERCKAQLRILYWVRACKLTTVSVWGILWGKVCISLTGLLFCKGLLLHPICNGNGNLQVYCPKPKHSSDAIFVGIFDSTSFLALPSTFMTTECIFWGDPNEFFFRAGLKDGETGQNWDSYQLVQNKLFRLHRHQILWHWWKQSS